MGSVGPNLAIAVAITAVVLIVVVTPSHAETPCDRAHDAEFQARKPLFEAPAEFRCDKAGNLLPLQFERRKIYCVTPEGQRVTSPSRQLRRCLCPVTAHAAQQEGKAVPQCDAEGFFRRQQSDGTSKTCVDPNTGQVTKGPVPNDQPIDC